MKTRVAINGFGRIGRNAFKIAFARTDCEIVAINDLTDTKTLAYLLKHDSNYGTYDKEVTHDDQNVIVEGKPIRVFAEKDPAALPWGDNKIDVVIESTGRFTDKDSASLHIKAGAKRVVISGPTKSDGVDTVVLGANDDKLEGATEVISNASCTTNSLGAVMAILDAEFGVEKSMLTTVHSYTASQVLQDAPAKDLREGRNAAENIVPTTTGAAIAVTLTLPQLKDKFDGLSIRVPTPVVSLSDITALLKRSVSVEEVNEVFKKAAKEPYFQGILDVSEEPLVSSDYIGNSHSGIVDLLLTKVVGGNLIKVMVWYDNEWGYSNRLVEVVADTGKHLHKQTSHEGHHE
jgi:glyceraldehyde 3-phosphate dehydrogenase